MARASTAVAGQKVNVHQLYRKAEGIEEHIQTVSVPPCEAGGASTFATATSHVPWRARFNRLNLPNQTAPALLPWQVR